MRAFRPSALLAAVVLAMACANWPLRRQPAPVAPPPPEPHRTLPYPVFETKAFARAVERGTRTRTGEPGTELLAAVRALPHRRRAGADDEPDQRTRDGSLLQPLARHAAHGLDFSQSEPLRADVAAQRRPRRSPAARKSCASPSAGQALREARHGSRLLDRRHAHARRPAARARAARLARLRHRVGVPASARRRAARGHDRRRVHGRVLVSAVRRLRRRHRLADRSLPRQRRVLHGLRGLRREPQRAARLARRRHGRADESERRAVAANARPTRRVEAKQRASCTSCASRIAAPDTTQGDEHRIRRRAHLALPRAQRARLRLGRVGEIPVGRDRRRRRRPRPRRPSGHDGDQHLLPARGARVVVGQVRASTSEAPSSFSPAICGRTRGRR